MSDSDEKFDKGESGALNTELKEAGRMKPGSLIMMKETFACRVTHFSTAKPGKHGSAKAMVMAKDIFNDKQHEETFGTGDMIPAPIVTKIEMQCMSYDEDGTLQILDGNGEMLEHLNLPTESHLSDVVPRLKAIVDAANKECLVTVQKWGEQEQVIAVREGNDF